MNTETYPKFPNKKTLSPCGDDVKNLGAHQALLNVNLPALMRMHDEGKATVAFPCNGKTYYFSRSRVEAMDHLLSGEKKRGITVTLILLNAPRFFDSFQEKELLDICIHPDFTWDDPQAFISAFPMNTEGRGYYQAFVEFLAKRYAGADNTMSCVRGLIVSNEINSQYIWGNAGEKTPEAYMKEYTETLRMTMESARRYYSNMRVYVSLDHHFNNTNDPLFPGRYYTGRQVLELLNRYSKENGDFDWGVAWHCYPENLFYPDFYNDRTADFDFSTPRITFKNIEMLPTFLNQNVFLYHGQHRHIILSEQGFNAGQDSFTEKQCAAAYALAYQKIDQLPDIDMFMYHAYADNPHEFGLHLGLRRRNPDGSVGEPRPIYYCMRDMGTEREGEWIQKARSFIGDELYERLLHPVIYAGERQSLDLDFDN